MSNAFTRSLALSGLAAVLLLGPAMAQVVTSNTPVVGQPGKDVMWLPSHQSLVDRMLDMAKLTVDDYVIDLGSGDGRTVITAARRGAKAHGIEFDAGLVKLSRENAAAAGVEARATFEEGDIFKSDFSAATVVTMFLLSDLNLQLRPILLNMKPNTRVVSNTFDMNEWTPDAEISAAGAGCATYCGAFLWIVPAKVAGTWRLPEGELVLEQTFQMLKGTLKSDQGTTPIRDGRLRGDEITFKVGERIFRGKVQDNRMEGVFGTETKWQATKR